MEILQGKIGKIGQIGRIIGRFLGGGEGCKRIGLIPTYFRLFRVWGFCFV